MSLDENETDNDIQTNIHKENAENNSNINNENVDIIEKSSKFNQSCYDSCYYLGIIAIRIFKRVGKLLGVIFSPVRKVLRIRVYEKWLGKRINAIKNQAKDIKNGFKYGFYYIKKESSKNFARGFVSVFHVIGKGFSKNKNIVKTFFNVAFPAASIVLLCLVVSHWLNISYIMKVTYNDMVVGYVDSEQEFDEAAKLMSGRIANINNKFHIDRNPKYNLVIENKDKITDSQTLCDNIIRCSSDKIIDATGVYVDNEFFGAVIDKESVDFNLKTMLAKYQTGDPGEEVKFLKDVKLVDGIYPTETVDDAKTMNAKLSGNTKAEKKYVVQTGDTFYDIAKKESLSVSELMALNPNYGELIKEGDELVIGQEVPMLGVQISKQEVYTASIPYTTEKIQDDTKLKGYTNVSRQGEEGQEQITAKVTYVNGQETNREIVDTQLTKEAVSKQIVEGTKQPEKNTVATITGRFMVPVSGYHYLRGFSSYHKGVDLGAAKNSPVYASDGGTVLVAGWYYNYGNTVIIQHNDGYSTLCAHNTSVAVKVGQKVNQGDVIAYVGSTGDSTCNHCHFEIRLNGRPQNPENYIKVR